MSYVDEVCRPLIRVLEHDRALQAYQLAGHTANIDFWIDEVLHALALIDGYRSRFKNLKSAQEKYEREHPKASPDLDRLDHRGEPIRPHADRLMRETSPDSERKQLRRELVDSAQALLDRIERERLLSQVAVEDLRKRLSSSGDIE